MKENNIILNLGLDTIPKYLYGGFFGPFRMLWDAIFNKEKIELEKKLKKEDTVDVSTGKSASTKNNTKKVTTTKTVSTTNLPETPSSATPASTSTGNMDWITSDYGLPGTTVTEETQETVERTPFSANDFVWGEDSPLSKMHIGVTYSHLKNNLQDLLNLYNMKVAETIGQKRS